MADESSMLPRIAFFAVVVLISIRNIDCQCSKDEYKRCVLLADPLLKDPRLIYPDNLRDIDHVCRSWSQFVDCVKKYTDRCFTENKRKEFNKAVESPVDLVHQICTSHDYQTEYLNHASCMRQTLTEDSHCGRHYRHLVSQVSAEPVTPALCCSHYRFRECVLDQTRRTCDNNAGPFAKQIMDKAMGFLKDQCSTYKPDESGCPGTNFYFNQDGGTTFSNDPVKSTSDKAIPWTVHSSDGRRTTGRKSDYSSYPWTNPSIETQPSRTDEPNSRVTYSRAMNWASTTDSSDSNTWTETVSSSPEILFGQIGPQIGPTTAISNSIVDEPNQQGLSNENSATKFLGNTFILIFITTFCFLI